MAQVFQLTAVSQNDSGCSYGANYTGTLKSCKGGTLRMDSSPEGQPVPLPIPPVPPNPAPPSPTWFLVLNGSIEDASLTFEVNGPDPGDSTSITLAGSDVQTWMKRNKNDPTNEIYKKGNCGIFGYAAPYAPNGWIYTITVAVDNPQLHGSLPPK